MGVKENSCVLNGLLRLSQRRWWFVFLAVSVLVTTCGVKVQAQEISELISKLQDWNVSLEKAEMLSKEQTLNFMNLSKVKEKLLMLSKNQSDTIEKQQDSIESLEKEIEQLKKQSQGRELAFQRVLKDHGQLQESFNQSEQALRDMKLLLETERQDHEAELRRSKIIGGIGTVGGVTGGYFLGRASR